MFHANFFNNLPKLRPPSVRRKRLSSYARDLSNFDFIVIQRLETRIFAEIEGAGQITHFWVTMDNSDKNYLRKILLRIYWDHEEHPSVEVPIGDFFGLGHGLAKNFWSLPLDMSPREGKGFNCWWPMPFGSHARFEIQNETKRSLVFYFYIDYEAYDQLEEGVGRFHACWHRVNPCKGIDETGMTPDAFQLQGINTDLSQNYVIMETEGHGHYVGCHLDIHNLRETAGDNWPGEGDDMIYIDGDPTPTLYGTGTEDFFNTAWSPSKPFSYPFHGIILGGGRRHSGKISYYRYHIADPIYFQKSIKVTIEHGHANHRSDDYSSTAYWYQNEPHKPFQPMLPVDARLPRLEPGEKPWEDDPSEH
jgi:D-arabinan exo alpha-(1,3)/(1,5)-arabinofuranosidase (non-reducing end)